MRTDWQPDDAAAYLTSGADNFALHRVAKVERAHPPLDHLGFMVPSTAAVEAWHARLSGQADRLGIEILGKPRLHRDGASSFYLIDPASYSSPVFHLLSGGLMLGAFYMATDMATSPFTLWGQVVFGIGAGIIVVIIRLFGGFPEGVMYSILLMNSLTPLINRYTLPKTFGSSREKGAVA